MLIVVFSFFAQCLQTFEIQLHKNLSARKMKKTYRNICICQIFDIPLSSGSGKKPERTTNFIHLLNFFIMKQFDEIYNFLTENQFFTDEELILLCCINGHSVDTLNSAIYARYGFRNIEGLLDDLS